MSSDRCKDISIDPKTDYDAPILMAVQAIIATVWWFLMLISY